MMSVVDFYNLSERMCKIFDSIDAFGVKHMVVFGDFGQLPPPGDKNKALYSAQIAQRLSGDLLSQKATMGKCLWHMFTVVVLLRENMRQRGMSAEDIRFREALINLRFGSCTREDLVLFSTRIAGPAPGQPNILQPQFKDVSIATAKNAVRDAVVSVRPSMYADSRGAALHTFVSRDKFPTERGSSSAADTRRLFARLSDPSRSSNELPIELRDLLWGLSPRRTDHVAGRLQLCLGMPMLLKANQATKWNWVVARGTGSSPGHA